MPDYFNQKEWNEKQLLGELGSAVIRLEREQKAVTEIKTALAAFKSSNGGEPKRE